MTQAPMFQCSRVRITHDAGRAAPSAAEPAGHASIPGQPVPAAAAASANSPVHAHASWEVPLDPLASVRAQYEALMRFMLMVRAPTRSVHARMRVCECACACVHAGGQVPARVSKDVRVCTWVATQCPLDSRSSCMHTTRCQQEAAHTKNAHPRWAPCEPSSKPSF